MDDELTPEQKFAAESPETMVPRALIQGRTPDDIAADLARLDWSPIAAYRLIARVQEDLRRFNESPASRERLIREARKQMFAGLLLALLAAMFTGLTFIAAIAGALPVFVVTFGLFLWGLALANRGWSRWRLYRGDTLLIHRSVSESSPD